MLRKVYTIPYPLSYSVFSLSVSLSLSSRNWNCKICRNKILKMLLKYWNSWTRKNFFPCFNKALMNAPFSIYPTVMWQFKKCCRTSAMNLWSLLAAIWLMLQWSIIFNRFDHFSQTLRCLFQGSLIYRRCGAPIHLTPQTSHSGSELLIGR